LERWRERVLGALRGTQATSLTEHVSWTEVEMVTRFDVSTAAEGVLALESLLQTHAQRVETIQRALGWLREEAGLPAPLLPKGHHQWERIEVPPPDGLYVIKLHYDPMTETVEECRILDGTWQRADDGGHPIAYLRMGTEHRWVPLTECGDLAEGRWAVQMAGVPGMQERKLTGGKWEVYGTRVTHVLSPWMGPLP
jgi:hypothetical protein